MPQTLMLFDEFKQYLRDFRGAAEFNSHADVQRREKKNNNIDLHG